MGLEANGNLQPGSKKEISLQTQKLSDQVKHQRSNKCKRRTAKLNFKRVGSNTDENQSSSVTPVQGTTVFSNSPDADSNNGMNR